MTSINKSMTIKEVLDMDQNTIPIFMRHGMHCLGCPAASGESIEMASVVHGIDPDKLVEDINDYLGTK
jgi:hybrid cluster-associated redox disulfide protein